MSSRTLSPKKPLLALLATEIFRESGLIPAPALWIAAIHSSASAALLARSVSTRSAVLSANTSFTGLGTTVTSAHFTSPGDLSRCAISASEW